MVSTNFVLLAIDLGVKTGLARYSQTGRLLSYGSRNFGTTARLRRAAGQLLAEDPGVTCLVLEGGGPLADIWQHAAEHLHIPVRIVPAERWRRLLLYPRQQRNGRQAKLQAGRLARRVISWSGAPQPTSLRHDAAEAILLGLWGVLELGWLPALPAELRP